ncbi:methionine ABC transporter ATP-binding protein [Gleimia sp. 6138-11-ORH1]|uniref:methionine ABC transporter ATP-binding protein n=1 Tax=Gleimia sp. 6138-11-ORH1 TaxID=2973937 RepID=UPI00216737F5|nr:methionine ABC transporter ATP-binding protein [Gleimia sp. 6138-11-ORH1]MCS4484992.1 methionine ABC transporter ATP-binding protein [Gleimia sp. 6138-11-ORH1]
MSADIKLTNVSKRYTIRGGADVLALKNVSLEIEAGSIHGIVGQSGAGKSTLIRCLTALEKPTEGEILLGGENLSLLSENELRRQRRRIGMVFQAANLFDSRTALDNVAYPLRVAGENKQTAREKAAELLAVVGLRGREKSYPSQLSGGQRQRVGIARALAANPSVLLCDEPTSALDSETTRQVLALLKDIRERFGVTIIIITHEMEVVRLICDSVSLLEHGQVIESGKIAEVVADPSSRLAHELVPLPAIENHVCADGYVIVDTAFTSHPGIPTGAQLLSIASAMGADVAAGTFESLPNIQVGRLALTVQNEEAKNVIEAFRTRGFHAEVRR